MLCAPCPWRPALPAEPQTPCPRVVCTDTHGARGWLRSLRGGPPAAPLSRAPAPVHPELRQTHGVGQRPGWTEVTCCSASPPPPHATETPYRPCAVGLARRPPAQGGRRAARGQGACGSPRERSRRERVEWGGTARSLRNILRLEFPSCCRALAPRAALPATCGPWAEAELVHDLSRFGPLCRGSRIKARDAP